MPTDFFCDRLTLLRPTQLRRTPLPLTLIRPVFLLPVVMLISGCGDGSGPAASANPGPNGHAEHGEHGEHEHGEHDEHEDEHEHEHEHEHVDHADHDEHGDHGVDGVHGLDHHIPEHRPDSYADLVQQLRKRPAIIRAEARHDREQARHELEELHDIIRWLPEIAADTDLIRRDWETANRIAHELAELVPAASEEFISMMQPDGQSAARYDQSVKRLEELIPRAELD